MFYQFLSILYKFEMDTSGQFFIVKLPDLKLLDPIFEDSPGWFSVRDKNCLVENVEKYFKWWFYKKKSRNNQKIWAIYSGWWFQPICKNISQNGNLPQIGVKIRNI